MSKNDVSDSLRSRVISLSSLEHMRDRRSVVARPRLSRQDNIAVISLRIKRAALVAMALVVTLFYPAGAYVQAEGSTEVPPSETSTTTTETPASTTTEAPTSTATSDPAPTTPPPTSSPAPTKVQGPTQPPGPERTSYELNPDTGLYENDKYTWDPVTKQTKPKTETSYSYNPATGMWDTTEWRYDAPTGKYVPNTISVATNPASKSSATPLGSPSSTSSSNNVFDLFYNAKISNVIGSSAASGDAAVIGNTLGGSALSGDALAMANIINLLQSSASFSGGEIATFSSDIYGDVFGDLYIDPAVLASLQPASLASEADITLNVEDNGQINNDISVDARSGDATVAGNTTGGNATSGNATAVLNLINMINSAISTGSSFIGALNIYGSLNGDILLPQNMLDALLAVNSLVSANNTNLDAELTSTQNINNLINASANSGSATVTHNTTAGSATSGDANTNITLLNLTGRQVVGSNSLLVFVNVLGKWVGVIMDAPAGTTSAALGTGITENTQSLDVEVDAETNSEINNQVDINATSGDATVENNTNAGNATSGDADTAVNILNITNSSFSLADWFGVLFINVFGEWTGSFGVDTEAGERPSQKSVANKSTVKKSAPKSVAADAKVFRFVPTDDGGHSLTAVEVDQATMTKAVQAATKAVEKEKSQSNPTSSESQGPEADSAPQQRQVRRPDLLLPTVGFLIGSSLIGTERIVSRRQRNRA